MVENHKKKIETSSTKKKVETKKVEHKTKKENKVLKENNKNLGMDTYKIVSISLGIIGMILIIGILALTFLENTNIEKSNKPLVLVIEDNSCDICDNSIATQIKEKLMPNLEIRNLDFNSKKGKKLIELTKTKVLPIFIFNDKITNITGWNEELKTAFKQIVIDGEIYYLLEHSKVPYQTQLVNELEILNNTIVIGNKNAKVTIYEFTDFECPFCAVVEGSPEILKAYLESPKTPKGYIAAMPEIKKNYIDTGKVKLVFYNMPIEGLHPQVRPIHLANLCANEQGKALEFKEKVFLDRNNWVNKKDNLTIILNSYANELNLDMSKFTTCLDSKKYNNQINNEIKYGTQNGVSGTPAFFIGKTSIQGAQPYSVFKKVIDKELAKVN